VGAHRLSGVPPANLFLLFVELAKTGKTVSECHRFREEDLEVLLSVAAQASIAIEKARLRT
jgi:GAF domain-containing protein